MSRVSTGFHHITPVIYITYFDFVVSYSSSIDKYFLNIFMVQQLVSDVVKIQLFKTQSKTLNSKTKT